MSKRIVVLILVVLLILSIYAILFIQFGIGIPLGYVDNWEKANELLLNLAFSYLTGIVLFSLTSLLPSLIKQCEFRHLLERDVQYLSSISPGLVRCIFTPTDLSPNKENADAIISEFREKSYYDIVPIRPKGYSKRIIDYIIDNKIRVDDVLKAGLVTYKDYLSVEEIEKITDIIDPSVTQALIEYKMTPAFDNPHKREELAYLLLDQVALIKELRDLVPK